MDPEGRALTYRFEIDRVDSFDGEDLAINVVDHTGTGETIWALAEDDIELIANSLWYGRVRALDADGIGSSWAVIEFLVRGGNDAPPPPTLISPEDGSTVSSRVPVFVVGNVEDPEGDLVGYQFRVSPDIAAEYVLHESGVIPAGGGPSGTEEVTTWQVPGEIAAELYWTARAVDEHGAASEWAIPFLMTVGTGIGGGCDQCSAVAAPSASPFALLLLLPLIAVRRRR